MTTELACRLHWSIVHFSSYLFLAGFLKPELTSHPLLLSVALPSLLIDCWLWLKIRSYLLLCSCTDCHVTALPLLHLPLLIIAFLPPVECCLHSVYNVLLIFCNPSYHCPHCCFSSTLPSLLIDSILCIFYVIHAVAAILLHRCNALILLLPSVNCCFSPSWLIVAYFMFPGCHLTKDPANTASNLAFHRIAITASWLLILTYLLLRALEAAVISLRYFAALLLLMIFSPLTALATAKNTAVSTTVACCCILLLWAKHIVNLQSLLAWWRHHQGCCCFDNDRRCQLIVTHFKKILIIVAVIVALTAPCTIAKPTTVSNP